MARIFISYSRRDETFARRLATSLSQLGADVWLDVEDIPAGMKWSSAIQHGLDAAQLMIIILSPDSMESRNVEDEWYYFLDSKKPLIPVLLRQTKIHFQLNRMQYVDFSNQTYEQAFDQLMTELQNKGVFLSPRSVIVTPGGTQVGASAIRAPYTQPARPPVAEWQPGQPRRSQNRTLLFAIIGLGAIATLIIGGILLLGLLNRENADATPTSEATTAVAVIGQPSPTPSETPPPLPPTPLPPTPAPSLGFPGYPVQRNADWQTVSRTIGGVDMVLVPVGGYSMGVDRTQFEQMAAICQTRFNRDTCQGELLRDQSPSTEIEFDQPFWIDRNEVSNAAYGSAAGAFQDPQQPRTQLNWDSAQSFCVARGGRLPTEAEWEYAARGPDGLLFPWGNTWDGQTRLNYCGSECEYSSWRDPDYNDGFGGASPVGAFGNAGASWVGAYDMAGNAWEWTSSIYQPYPYDAGFVENLNDTSAKRTLRGGSWNWILGEANSVSRASHYNAGPLSDFYGFRCVMDYHEGDLD